MIPSRRGAVRGAARQACDRATRGGSSSTATSTIRRSPRRWRTACRAHDEAARRSIRATPRRPHDSCARRFDCAGEPDRRRRRGHGLSAPCAREEGGADLIIIYNSGRFRMAGRGSPRRADALRRRERDRAGHGARGASGRARHAGAGGRVRHRPVPRMTRFLREVRDTGLRGRPELPDRRADRRHVSHGPRRDRHGLRARGRDDRHGRRAGPADRAVLL